MSSADKANQKPIIAFVGIDWADQKHDIALRAVCSQAKPEHHRIESQPEALTDWVLELRERFSSQGKILICLEHSRGALIHFLMGYDCFELYPINPKQLDNYRKAFHPSGAKESLKKAPAHKLRKFFYGHQSRNEQKIQARIERIHSAEPLTQDSAIIEASSLTAEMLAHQLKDLAPYIDCHASRRQLNSA